MLLDTILQKYEFHLKLGPIADSEFLELVDVTLDPPLIQPNYLFITNPSSSRPQMQECIETAIKMGSLAIICQDEDLCRDLTRISPNIIFLVPDEGACPRYAFRASIIQEFYPGVPDHLAAVTGTNGKSSVVTFTRQILGLLGKKAASLGTLGVSTENCPDFQLKVHVPKLTTYDPVNFHKVLSRLTNGAGVDYCALEATSHGLDQHRLHGVKFQIGIFTNLTQDHLDYHGSMSEYFRVKCLLFSQLVQHGGLAILSNRLDSERRSELDRICAHLRVWTYGEGNGDLHYKVESGKVLLSLWGKEVPLPGNIQSWPKFHIENILAAIGTVAGFGEPLDAVLGTLPYLETVPGRAEWVGMTAEGGNIFVDFAHTPDALQSILKSFRGQDKVHVVFGCGGDRDATKRVEMGRIASEYADHVIVTDDNPRMERPELIRAQILAGCQPTTAATVEEVGDRREAIRRAIACLGSGVLIIAGKGAETVQIIGNEELPFCDKFVVEGILLEFLKLRQTYENKSKD